MAEERHSEVGPAATFDPMLPQLAVVVRTGRETQDTFTLRLAPPAGEGFAFAPGQFNMLTAFGIGESPISISGDPGRPQELVHTIRAVGAVTQALCGLKPGEVLGVRGPFGTPWPVKEAAGQDLLIIAGGLGLAPLRPAVCQALQHRALYGGLELIYGARTPQDLLYFKELQEWRGRFDFRVHVTVDASGPDWRSNVGVVTNLIARARFDPHHTTALICGPGIMMRFVVRDLINQGVPLEKIFVSMERNMQCGLGLCGHCQLGPLFVCKDGPVFSYAAIKEWFDRREV
jgi:NAD(P)H-flavin reductase